MKKIIGLVFAMAMILSLAFIGEMSSGNNPLSAKAQVSVRKKKSGGLYGKSKRGVKYVYRKGKNGVVYVYRKTAKGTVYVGRKGYQGGKYVTKKSYQGGKYVTKKTVKGTKKVVGKTKDILVGH